jgi:RNA polymerase sigma-70 factor, ECF subfamily
LSPSLYLVGIYFCQIWGVRAFSMLNVRTNRSGRCSLTENTTLHSIRRWFSKENENPVTNADVFARLYEETHLMVFRYAYGLSGGPAQEVEDLTAETYTRAWKTRHHFNGNGQAALGWLLRIARNLAIDLSRRRKVHEVNEDVDVESLLDRKHLPEVDVIEREQIKHLWQMLNTLSEEVREMVVLRYMLGWQVKQIAEYLEMTENNVSVTIRRAIKSLQRDWAGSQEKDNE